MIQSNFSPFNVKRNSFEFVAIKIPLLLILAWVAGTQFFGISKDYDQYLNFFDSVRSSNSYFKITTRFEPAFTFLSYVLTRSFVSNSWIYGFFVFLALVLKAAGLIGKQNDLKYFVIFFVFYLVRYFPLYELTQLRVAVSLSIVFFVYLQKTNDQRDWRDIGLLILAVLFHYSSAVIFLIYFVRKINRLHVVFAFFAVLAAGVALKQTVLAILPSFFIVFRVYNEVGFGEVKASLISSTIAIDLFLIIIAFIFWEKNNHTMKVSILFLAIGLAIYWGFMDLPLIAHRFKELTSVFALVYVMHSFKSGYRSMHQFSYAMFIINISTHTYLNYVRNPLIVNS